MIVHAPRFVRPALAAAAVAVLAACAASPPSETVPDVDELAARVGAVWEAWARADWRAVYAQESPSIRRAMTYEAWLRDHRLDDPVRAKGIGVVSGRLLETCGCGAAMPGGRRTCTAITEVVSRDGAGKTSTERVLESWEHEGRAWSHVYIGAGQACPGRASR